MKRILFILAFVFCFIEGFSQFPITQNIGSSNTLVRVPANGGLQGSLINRNFTDTTEANTTQIDYYSGSQIFTTSDQIFWVRNAAATAWINLSAGGSAGELLPFNGCVKGCTVTWIENYDYEVVASTYFINGVMYESSNTTVTLDPADPTNDRIDIFVLNTSSTAAAVTGTPAATPEAPDVDPTTQLQISFALVAANTTEPTISNLWIYRENAQAPTEWNTATPSGSINLASTNFPYAGTVDIEATNMPSLASFTATSGSTVNWGNYDAVVFKIRSKGNWTANRPLSIFLFNTSLSIKTPPVILVTGQYGFNSSTTGQYQNVTIPLADFGDITNMNAIQFARTGGTGTIGWYIDDIQLTNINYEPPASSGTVTLVSSGNLSPLFTTTVSNATSTPTINFTLSNAAGGTVFGNATGSSAAPSYTSTPILGIPGTTIGTIRLAGNTSGTVTITPAAAAGTWTFTLPTTDGNSGEYLQTDGNGVTSWAAISGSGTVTDFIFTDGSGFDGTVTTSTTTPTLALTTSLTTGSVPFIGASGALSQDNATFFWDNSSKELGIGTNVPTATLQIEASSGSYLLLAKLTGGSANRLELERTTHGILRLSSENGDQDANIIFSAGVSGSNTRPLWYTGRTGGDPSPFQIRSYHPTGAFFEQRIFIQAQGELVINEGSLDRDSRIESDGNTHMVFVDAGANTVSIGTSTSASTLTVNGTIQSGLAGTTIGGYLLAGNTSGTISILPQAAAGTYNFNLPTTAGTSGYLLTSGGGGSTAMTWTDPATITGVNIYNSNGTLTSTRTVTAGTVLTNWTSTQTSTGSYALVVSNSTAGGAFSASNAGNGNAIFGQSTTGSGVRGEATSGNGINGTASTGVAGRFRTTVAATNTTTEVMRVIKGSDGTASTGIGGYLALQLEDEGSSDRDVVRLGWVYTTVSGASSTGDFTISTVNAGTVAERMRVAGDGTVTMSAYGAGTATFDASGVISSVSDERVKRNIAAYNGGLNEIMNINPISYQYNGLSGNETSGTYVGFSAQNVLSSLGENATGRNSQGYLSIQDRAIMAAMINSIKELNQKVERLERELKQK